MRRLLMRHEVDHEQPENRVIYWLDKDDRIQQVNDVWERFADENGGQSLQAQNVCGQDLWRYVAGDTTRLMIGSHLTLARVRGEPTQCEYRCDSPGIRRVMQMRIVPISKRELRIEHSLIRAEPLARPISFTSATGRNSVFTVRCSFCNRLKIEGHWCEPDSDVALQHIGKRGSVAVIYGVCRRCMDSLSTMGVSRSPPSV